MLLAAGRSGRLFDRRLPDLGKLARTPGVKVLRVQFIYIHPPAWYLSIDLERKRDVVELPINGYFDINGWDIRKALSASV
ncbi:MAG: nucleotidyltransferase domain-containing protein [Anaerolineae bacterium]|nr:nucleotidyltransferase domain-containing protein [Anaerolineae bacterium]